MKPLFCFIAKQFYAAIFGILLLVTILVTFAFYPANDSLPRYDFLFIVALGIQILLIAAGMETWREARVVLVFHIVGTLMELFKTHMGSWSYPEANYIRLYDVPLFSGFMYAAVGSYMARAWRLFDMSFEHYPPFWITVILGGAIYANFYTHHFIADIRYGLFAATILIFWRTRTKLQLNRTTGLNLSIITIFILIAAGIYLAENLATYGRAWVYPNQELAWQMVPFAKFGSWFLLMLVSWVLVSALRQGELKR